VRWKLELSFDSQLCQKYLYPKIMKKIMLPLVTIKNVENPFLRHSVHLDISEACTCLGAWVQKDHSVAICEVNILTFFLLHFVFYIMKIRMNVFEFIRPSQVRVIKF